uniref:Uncharacterized protein n=1 Tax=Stomoxys calcitrans TaxID=35570 RepID=A0A1I8PCD0_STOCA
METVVLSSDIARLVLDYLKSQNLKRAIHAFCKTSPYLKQEFSAFKHGLQTHSFFPELEEIICEYVKILRKVDQELAKLNKNVRFEFQRLKLSEKVSELLDRAIYNLCQDEQNSNAKDDLPIQQTANSGPNTSNSINSDKENNNIGKKRKRICDQSNNEEAGDSKTKESPSSRISNYAKKRRVLEPYCFLSAKALQKNRRRKFFLRLSPCTAPRDFDTKTGNVEDDDDDEWSSSGLEDVTVESDGDDDEVGDEYVNENENELFNGEKPRKESTPRSKSQDIDKLRAPILPEISQAILENPEFQLKLVENINQALNNSSTKNDAGKTTNCNVGSQDPLSQPNELSNSNDNAVFSSNQLLDQMVKSILEATEKDPSFDAVIHDVVEASNKPSVHSAGVQCDLGFLGEVDVKRPLYTSTEPPPLVPTRPQPPIVQQRVQPQPNDAGNNIQQIEVPPRTPLIIRNAVAAANASINSAQDPPSLTANNSFGSLIDPNFSISKLIVLNSNDSAQKQHPEPSIGNITADNLISQLSTSGVVNDGGDEQVYFDASTGQLTLPLYLTNDGLLANFPFLINNEIVTQQLQPSNIANMDASRIEIPLPEPIVVTADQLPPNSIIFGSSQKLNQADNSQANQQTAEKVVLVCDQKQTLTCNTGPPGSLDTRLMTDKATPSASGIVNTKAYRSLSTPRKRASHVRTLTFSPRGPHFPATLGSGVTPVSTRRETLARTVQRTLPKSIPDEGVSLEILSTSEKPIIKNIEILPAIASNDTSSKDAMFLSANESATNVPPLFVTEESSNQTVINKHASTAKDLQIKTEAVFGDESATTVLTAPENTPKRKQTRKNAVRACKRRLSKSQVDEEESAEKAEKENEINTPPPDSEEYQRFMLEEWNKARNSSTTDLDVRLRELNSKMTVLKPVKKVNTKKRVRRKKPAATKRKEKEMAEEAEELEISRELLNESQEANLPETEEFIPQKLKAPQNTSEGEISQMTDEKIEKENNAATDNAAVMLPVKKGKKMKEIAIKLPTPQKSSVVAKEKNLKSKETKKEKAKRTRGVSEVSQNLQQTAIAEAVSNVKQEDVEEKSAPLFSTPMGHAPHQQHQYQNTTLSLPHVNEALEREKRTSNIAFLLETPYKDPNLSNMSSVGIPPTPGIFAPSLETPAGKNKNPQEEMVASTSFLFGSLTKSELDTPLMSVLTPGFRFTPFGMKETATPRSATGTDYSSGGSYYKPDESEDLDRNIDKILKDSAQKKFQQEQNEETDRAEDNEEEREEGEIRSPIAHESDEVIHNQVDAIEVEIAVEKLKVEPIVLKRVKSFGSEAVDSIETAKIDPHYTLASGLPEISAAEESSSSSSSSSSSGSSSSSSNSSSSSSASKSTGKSKTVVEITIPKKLSDLDNLSEISSTEDEEWKKCITSNNNENSQLVNIDGEVRYPVRSWLTPVKETLIEATSAATQMAITATTTQSTIKVTLPVKSAEKRNRQVKELELKRERMKEKLKRDATSVISHEKSTSSASTAPNISAALAASRIMHAMRDKGKKPACFEVPQSAATTNTSIDEKRSIDVLTALRLSAKKQLPTTPEDEKGKSKSKLESPMKKEDNGAEPVVHKTPENKETPIQNLSSATRKTPQRKCLPIEARPVTKTIRKSNKKIVRTPLAFKTIHSPGKINSHSTTTTLAELANKSKDCPTSPTVPAVMVSTRLVRSKKTKVKKPQEAPTDKIKVSPKSIKPKSGAKVKVTRATSKKKPVSKKPEKEKITLLDQRTDGELIERIEEQISETSPQASSIKPKIHIKAANSMVPINNGKANKSSENGTEKAMEELKANHLKYEKRESSIPIETGNNQQSKQQENGGGDTSDASENDPIDDCAIVTFDETDAKRFVQFSYQGPDEPPAPIERNHDLGKFQMVVTLEDESHILRFSKGICLFSCPPAAPAVAAKSASHVVRNIPKKRKIRITSTSDDKSVTPAPNTKIAAASLKAFTTAAAPAATSTPLQPVTVASRTEKAAAKEGSKPKTSNGVKTPAEVPHKPTEEVNNVNEKLQIEDIESILSHLHGT